MTKNSHFRSLRSAVNIALGETQLRAAKTVLDWHRSRASRAERSSLDAQGQKTSSAEATEAASHTRSGR